MWKNLIKYEKDSLFKKSSIEGFILPKLKLFNQLKGMEELPTGVQTITEHFGEQGEQSEKIPIKVYNETLYSKGFIQKQPAATLKEKKQPLKRSSWESLGTIEHKIDDMGGKQTEEFKNKKQTSVDTNKKIDSILSKNKVRS
jgi:hypothetical protein